MSYQVRHRTFGIFQGVEKTNTGMAVCYYPAADSPEMGIYEFPTLDAANAFIKWALSIDTLKYEEHDLIAESYDKRLSERTQRFGIHVITLEHWARLIDKIDG
jgi:hypothetical protein